MDNIDLKARILAAAKKRVRGGFVTIGGERFAVDFRVYPAKEIGELAEKIRTSGNDEGCAILAEQVLDPDTKRPLFKGDEIVNMPNCDMVALLEAFMTANLGVGEKN